MCNTNSNSLSALLEKTKRQITDGDYDEALTSLRKIGHYMAKWLVYDAGRWDEARTNPDGSMYASPSFAQCIRILRIHRLIERKDRLMFESVLEYGNESAHETGSKKEDAEHYCAKMEEYLPGFLARFPNATGLNRLPNQASDDKSRTARPPQTRQPEVFGCDIGNGYGYISLLQNETYDPTPMLPVKYKLSIGMPTSAYIAPPDGSAIEVFSGQPAGKRHKRDSERFVHAVKTRLREGSIAVPGISKPVATDAVYAAIARDLISLGNEQRKNRGEAPIYDIVYTFPASFSGDLALLNRMQSSIESVVLDGKHIRVISRLPEPAAVAIDYLYYMQNLAAEDIRLEEDHFTVFVYDLGHGTFDAAVVSVRSKGRPYQMHLSDGLPEVGGKDFDQILYDEICRVLSKEYQWSPQNAAERELIRTTAEEMKYELSEADSSTKSLLVSGDYVDVEVTRARFEELSRPLIYQTLELVESMMERAKEQGIKVDAVVLSGGASQMPMVEKGLRELLKDEKISIRKYRPSEAVSYGAARYAYNMSLISSRNPPAPEGSKPEKTSPVVPPPVLEQGAEFNYGIWLPSEKSLRGTVRFMVRSGDILPAVSEGIQFTSASPRVVLKVLRSLQKNKKANCGDPDQCMEVIRLPFDVPADSVCTVTITVLEDYNVKVACKPEGGTAMEKSTADEVGKLV